MEHQDTCHTPSYPLLPGTWEVARKDSHLMEESEAQGGGHVRTLLPRGARAGRRDHGEGTTTLSPTSTRTVSAQAPSFFATDILGEPTPPSQQRRNPLSGPQALVPSATLDTESLLRHLGWEEDSGQGCCGRKGPGDRPVQGGRHQAGRRCRARRQRGGSSRRPECQGQGVAPAEAFGGAYKNFRQKLR